MKRLQVARSWDFNQMLVASVSGHLLLITFVLFLPKTVSMEKMIPPAFMVELVEVSQGEKKAAKKPSKKQKIPVPVKPEQAKAPKKPKLIEPVQQSVKVPIKPKVPAIDTRASDQILNSLEQLESSPTKLDKEFNQLAKQVPKAPVKPPVVEEKTFDESTAMENPLDQLASLKPTETLDEEPQPATPKQPDTRLKELEFASLSKYTEKPLAKQDEKSSADLLKELTEMKQPTLEDKDPAIVQIEEEKTPPISEEKSKAYESILKKLDSLETQPDDNDIDTTVVVPEAVVQKFESDIRKVSAPKQVQVDLVISPDQAYVQSSTPGEPGADALALYKGEIIRKVMENWNAPLGQNHDKKVVISFNIFPLGNIDRPDLQQSSDVELLDNLALRAIRASEPFPKFPESLKSSNLNISIHFKYIQEKNKT